MQKRLLHAREDQFLFIQEQVSLTNTRQSISIETSIHAQQDA
jgi:hypothetical protein